MKIILIVTLSFFGISSLCLSERQSEGQKVKMLMHEDAKSMKKEILMKVPIGSSIQDAKPIMEENDFGCKRHTNDGFVEMQENDPEGKGSIVHENADFLLCAKNGTPFLGVFREWRVSIVHKNDVVSDIFVNTWVTGP
jgi:hypothetical protein